MVVLFRFENGHLDPMLPITGDGRIVVADGANILTLEQAEQRTGRPASDLRQLWQGAYAGVFPETNLLGGATEDASASTSGRREIRVNLTEQQRLGLLHQVQYSQLTEDEFEHFIDLCGQRGLSPYCRHLIPTISYHGTQRKMDLITTIEAIRLVAQLHPDFAGRSDFEWCSEHGEWRDVWLDERPPAAARCTVYRRCGGQREAFSDIARWGAYAPYLIGENGEVELAEFWKKFGPEQLAKCAEARAYRSALGNSLRGLYIREEMEQARATEAEKRQTRMPARQPLAEGAHAAVADDLADCQLSEFELIDDPPVDEADFSARMRNLIPNAQTRAATIDAYRRKFRAQYQQNRTAWWSAVLFSVSKSTANQPPEPCGRQMRRM